MKLFLKEHNDVSVESHVRPIQDFSVPAAPECTPSSVLPSLQHTRPDSHGKMDPREHIRGNHYGGETWMCTTLDSFG